MLTLKWSAVCFGLAKFGGVFELIVVVIRSASLVAVVSDDYVLNRG